VEDISRAKRVAKRRSTGKVKEVSMVPIVILLTRLPNLVGKEEKKKLLNDWIEQFQPSFAKLT
jgi:hypothetical protein